MDSLIPSYLDFCGVTFPLMVGEGWVGLSTPPDELAPLTYVMWAAVNGDHKSAPLDEISRSGFHEQELLMATIDAAQPADHALAMLQWRRLSGVWPNPQDSFEVWAVKGPGLVIPRDAALPLLKKLRQLRDDIATGTVACRLGNDAVPSPPPLTPELEEFDFLWGIDKADAKRFARELYERRG